MYAIHPEPACRRSMQTHSLPFHFLPATKKQEFFICSCFAVIMPSLGAPL